MSHGPDLPALPVINLDGSVKALALGYFRMRNLLIDILNHEKVPQDVKDRIMVNIGVRPSRIDEGEIMRADKLYVPRL